MSDAPWLTIIGLGEDGPNGLTPASRAALDAAAVIIGPPRHLSLLPEVTARKVEWPVPFSDGIDLLLSFRGETTVALASGDPFWFGAGTTIARHLAPEEWRALPGPSTFSLAAAEMGWPLERTQCFGLHATPLERIRPALAPGQRLIVLLRDGDAVNDLAQYLSTEGFGPSALTVLEALGGPRARRTNTTANAQIGSFKHPVCAAIEVQGAGRALPLASGRPDDWFENDGQITKRPVRALTLSALAPRPGEHLWDIGGGSGSIAIEWLLSHPSLTATTIEPRPDRAARITENAKRFGLNLSVINALAEDALPTLPKPDVIFIGGGLSDALLTQLLKQPKGTRLVANAVTLETEALLTQAHAQHGGDLMRVTLSNTTKIGPKRGWKAAYPITQWSVTL